ncbi:MAG: beta-N-acetylhexosaminidase [Candidatus Tectomicrobia bacterium]|nr:beta-N-acetylhexosaminidase [Candidatus Tectomicrobia bacterium]
MKALAGSLIVAGLPGGEITEADRSLLRDLRPAGLVLYQRNARSAGQLARLCRDLAGLAERAGDPPPTAEFGGAPPLLLLDHEGGRVNRLPVAFTHFPPQGALGAINDPDLTEAVFRASALEVAALGVNVHLSPVLDLWTNPENKVIGDRAFGSDPERAARHGKAAARGIRSAGLLPVGKHFPGHGDTVADSHVDLPFALADRETLKRRELFPFRRLIEDGLPALMSAHIVVPALDPDRPATLSPKVIGEILRGEMGFGGLVLTDDMEMEAIAGRYNPGEAAVLSVEAGCDLLLFCHRADRQAAARDALAEAVQSGRIAEERLRESSERIRRVRESLKGRPPVGLDVIGCAAHRELLEEVRRRARKAGYPLRREGAT